MKHLSDLPEELRVLDADLRKRGLCIVPVMATRKMNKAASDALPRKRRKGGHLPWVSVREKAAIRWEAMLKAWIEHHDVEVAPHQERVAIRAGVGR